MSDIECAGDSRHPDHDKYLQELGRATFAASKVAGIAFDLLRVFAGVDAAEMYNDPLGTLENRLIGLFKKNPALPGLSDFLDQLNTARATRNDLLHALPVQDGLHRRRRDDHYYERNFFTVEDLRSATQELEVAHRTGSTVLYYDGGAAVAAWSAISP